MTWIKYWREIVIALMLVVVSITAWGWRVEHSRATLAQTEIQNSKVEFETFKTGVIQANNTMVKAQQELVDQMSVEFQQELKSQHQKLLMTIRGEMQVGFEEINGKIGQKDPNAPVYTYQDKVMDHIKVDATDPQSPLFSYGVRPFTLSLEGSLNLDQAEGDMKFWVLPRITNNPGIKVTTTRLELSPSPEVNQWLSRLNKKEVYLPVMPKWTVSGLMGREYLKELPGGFRNVYGGDVTYNFPNNLGVGGGFIGSTTFLKISYSFGK